MNQIETETYINDDNGLMEVRIDGDEVAIKYFTDGAETGSEIETLDRWNKFRLEREHDGWRRQS